MFRKFLKSFVGIYLMILFGGIFCLVPNLLFKSKNILSSSNTEIISTESRSNDIFVNKNSNITENSILDSWQNDIITNSVTLKVNSTYSKVINGYTFENLTNVVEISDAEQLAQLAYNVNTKTNYSDSYIYILTKNIDLSGKLWTPIGTYSNPFGASFIGCGYTISNIHVDDIVIENNSNNAAGLFGNVSSTGNISDLVLDGNYLIDSTKTKATLIGSSSGQVINCYTTSNFSSNLGTNFVNGGVVYKGTSLDGKVTTTYTAIEGTQTIKYYKFEEKSPASFYIANSGAQKEWYNGNILRVLSSGSTSNPIYSSKEPVLRVSASENDIYPLYEGYKPLMPANFSNNIGIIEFENSVNISNVFNYGYGTRTNIEVNIPYDMSFNTFFTNNPQYKQRLGYNFKTLNGLNESDLADKNYKTGFPAEGETITFTWEAQTSKSVGIQFVCGTYGDGADTSDFNSLDDVFYNNSISSILNCNDATLTNYTATLNGILVGENVQFSIQLKKGYKLQIYGDDTSVAFDTSGMYQTGTHPNYNINSVTQDSYNLITGSWEMIENVGQLYNTFNISISNIVANGGTLKIKIVREGIDVKFNVNKLELDSSLTMTNLQYTITYRINDNDDLSGTIWNTTSQSGEGKEENDYILWNWKLGQKIEIIISITDDSNYILSSNWNSAGDSYVLEKLGDNFNEKYYRINKFTFNNIESVEPRTLDVVAGPTYSKVKFEFYNENGELINSTSKEYDSIWAYINDINKNVAIPGAESLISMQTTNDIFYINTNGYYDIDYALIGSERIEFSLAQGENYLYVDNLNKLILEDAFANKDYPNYILKIYLKERIFNTNDASLNYYIDDNKIEGNNTINALFESIEYFSDDTLSQVKEIYSFGDKIYIKLTLTNLGKAVLYGDVNNWFIDNTDNKIESGFLASSSISNTSQVDNGIWIIEYTAGTYNISLDFKFNYKQIKGQIVGAKNSLKEDITDSNISNNNFVLKFNYDETNNKVQIVGVNTFTSVNIHSQYYLLGWYLQNGDIISDNYFSGNGLNSYFAEDTLPFYIGNSSENYVSAKTLGNIEIFTFNIYACIEKREINITYQSGEVGDGEISNYLEQQTYTIYYNQEYLLESQIYRNIGYVVSGFNISTNQGGLSKNNYNINDILTFAGSNWWYLWYGNQNYVNDNYSWTGLYNDSDSNVLWNDSQRTITIKYLWEKLTYAIIFDNGESNSTTQSIQIGNTIAGQDTNARNGQAKYSINGGSEIYAGIKNGYTAVGFKISQDENKDILEQLFSLGTTFVLDITNFKSIMSEEFYYSSEGCTIYLQTQRVGAKYKIYIQNSDYYDVTWNGGDLINGENFVGGQDSNGIFIYVTYGQEISQEDLDWTNGTPSYSLANLLSSNISKLITFTRTGYVFDTNRALQYNGRDFVVEVGSKYEIAQDITVIPTWSLVSQTVSSSVEFESLVQQIVNNGNSIYLLNEKVLTQNSSINDKTNTILNKDIIDAIVENGERISEYGFEIYQFNGNSYDLVKTIKNVISLNLTDFSTLNYVDENDLKIQIFFYVKVQDTLVSDNNGYTVKGPSEDSLNQGLKLTLAKNSIYFDDNNQIYSAYSNSNQFFATTSDLYDKVNTFGTVKVTYNWDGSINTTGTVLDFNKMFLSDNSNITINGDYNVGTNKNLNLVINTDTFNSITSINGFPVSKDTNWQNFLINTTSADGKNIYIANNIAEIVKGRFVIDFGSASSYYFDGQETIVYMSDENKPFNIGSKSFEYRLDKIIYIGENISNTYLGKEDDLVFEVKGLQVKVGGSFVDYSNSSFEYILNGSFELLSSTTAIKKIYQTKYITSNSQGQLSLNLEDSYLDITENLIINNIKVGGQVITNEMLTTGSLNGEFATYKVGNEVLFSFVGNNTPYLTIYINQNLISSNNVSFTISVDINTARQTNLSLLSFDTGLNVNNYISYFDTEYQNNKYSTDVSVTSSGDGNTTFAVLSDVRKVTIDYNGGYINQFNSTVLYLSHNTGDYILPDPEFNYSLMNFNGYSYTGTDPVLKNGNILSVTKGGQSVTLTAKWWLTGVAGTPNITEFDFYTSLKAGELLLSDIVNLESLESGIFEFVLQKDDSTVAPFEYNDGKFIVKDSRGWIGVNLYGTYTLTITLKYNDGVGGDYIKTREFNIQINITKNSVGIDKVSNDLTFNNDNQTRNVIIDILGNGDSVVADDKTLYELLLSETTTAKNYGIDIAIEYQENSESEKQQVSELRNAGIYTISISVNSTYLDIYELNSEKSSISVVINQFELDLNLTQYAQQVNLSKYFGEVNQDLVSDIVVTANNSDNVKIRFTRETGEAIGEYNYLTATIVEVSDERDYELKFDASTFTSKFEILTPLVNLQIEMSGTLNYIYNSQILNNIQVVYENGNFVVKGFAGLEEVKQTFELYYLNGSGQKVYIPENERNIYAGYLTFTSDSSITANAGKYNLNVALSEEGQNTEWNGVVFANNTISENYNKIIVNERTLYIDSATMEFNQQKSFTFTVGAPDNNAELQVRNNIASDTIIITGSFDSAVVGTYSLNLSLDETSEKNYNLSSYTFEGFTVTPSDDEVSTTFDEITLSYGDINKGKTTEQILNQNIQVAFKTAVSAIANEFLQITNHQIKLGDVVVNDSNYSTGGYLNSETYVFVFTVTSKNYTFGSTDDGNGNYTKDFIINVTINKQEITVSNTNNVITKKYDHNVDVLSTFVNQNINASKGYFTSGGILAGDEILVVSAEYENKEIGNNKKIVNIVYGKDYQNYEINDESLVGNITSVSINFKKNLETEEFVSDGDFTKKDPFIIEYDGNMMNFIQKLIDNYSGRVGYTQIGWEYNDEIVTNFTTENKTEFDAFLGYAIANNSSGGITLDAVWKILTYNVTIVTDEHTSVSHNITNPVNYYSSFVGDDKVNITINPGYVLKDVQINNSNAILQNILGKDTRTGNSFEIVNVVGDITITIVTREINVLIKVDLNEPEIYSATFVNNEDWQDANTTWAKKEVVLSYSDLLKDLPEIKLTTPNTFDPDGWNLNGELSTGNSIWERIGGDSLTQDSLEGITFVARWTEAEITIKIANTENTKSITVSNQDGEISLNNGVYNIKYNDEITITIQSKDWYKFTSFNSSGNGDEIIVDNFIGEHQGSGETNGTISFKALQSYTISLYIEEILVKFIPTKQEQIGATFTNNLLDKTYTYSSLIGKNIEDIGKYTLTEGTYDHIKWQYNSSVEVEFNKSIETFILENGGIPTKDCKYTFEAIFEGREYQITFNAGEGTFTNSDEDITITLKYGDNFTGMPQVTEPEGKHLAFWRSDSGESLNENDKFILGKPNPNGDYTILFTAQFTMNVYSITINIDYTHLEKVVVDGQEYTNGTITLENVVHGSSKTLIFTFKTGYEFNTYHFNSDKNATVQFSGVNAIISNIEGACDITITIKAKDYTLTIDKSQYETISKDGVDANIISISYDEEIAPKFNGILFDRDGYTVLNLIEKESGLVFATASVNEDGIIWDFASDFVDGGLYQTDKNLNLKVKWTSDKDYLSGVTTGSVDKYFSAKATEVANTEWKIASNGQTQTFKKGDILANGDEVVDIYYTVDDVRFECNGTDFKLYITDVVTNANAVMVVSLRDSLDSSNVYNLQSTNGIVTLLPSEIQIENENLVSYYTGTSKIQQKGDNFNIGEFYYQDTDKTQVSELGFIRVEIVDSSNEFNIGDNHQVKYIFSKNKSFKISNYAGNIKEENGYIVYYPQLDNAKAMIEKTPFTISISGQGFETGDYQKVTVKDYNSEDFISDEFVFNVNSIYTKDIVAKDYKLYPDELEIDYSITKNGIDKKNNFEVIINGVYTIISKDNGNLVSFSSKYLDLSNPELPLLVDSAEGFDSNDYIISVESFIYGKLQNITEDVYSFIDDEGNLIFTVYDNNSSSPKIIILKGKSVSFTYSINGTMSILSYADGSLDGEGAKNILDTLENEEIRTHQEDFNLSNAKTINIIMTDYKAIHLSLGDKGGMQTPSQYIKLGSNKEVYLLDDNKWTGFVFNGWKTEAGAGVIVSNTNVFVENSAKITNTTITASWEIETPIITNWEKSISRSAKVGLNENIDKIVNDEILTVGIDNYNSEITYSYTFLLNGKSLGNELIVPAKLSSEDDYTLKITASYKNGYVSKEASVEFFLDITLLDIGNITFNQTNFDYANYDYINDITVTFDSNNIGTKTLKELINASDTYSYYFTVSNSEIKNNGTYTVTLGLNKEIFNDKTYTQTITVNKFVFTVTQTYLDDLSLSSKPFGANDPLFEINHNQIFDKGTNENIIITLERNAGEESGTYNFLDNAQSSSENFVIKIEENLKFTISASDSVLNVTIDSQLSKVYNSNNSTFELNYNSEQSKWIITVNGGNSSTISLSITDENGQSSLRPDLYAIALNNIEILLDNAEDVNTYTSFRAVVGSGANFKDDNINISGTFTITPKELEIASVTKVFDRDNLIKEGNATYTNLESGDIVILQGNFSQITAGNNISLENLVLAGEDSSNYVIANPNIKGTITKKNVSSAQVNIGLTSFGYGQLYKGLTLNQLLSITNGANVIIDSNIQDDLQNGYVSIKEYSINENNFSTGEYVNSGNVNITFVIESNNFIFNSQTSIECALQVAVAIKTLDLSKLAIVKNYNGNNKLPNSLSDNLAGYGVLSGDTVLIDKENSYYVSSSVAPRIEVILKLIGQDAKNYGYINAYGEIKDFSITLMVDTSLTGEDFITDGNFVADNQEIVIKNPYFSFKYPNSLSANEILNQMKYPTRVGYKVIGWKYLEGEGVYSFVSEDNILTIIENIALDDENEEKQIQIYPVWEIEYYSVSVEGTSLDDVIITSDNKDEDGKIKYFTDFTISVKTNLGQKVMSYNTVQGSARNIDYSDTGNRNSVINVEGIESNLRINVTTTDIIVKVIIDTNIKNLLNTSRTDDNLTEKDCLFSDLSKLSKDDLPLLTVTDGTYVLSGYTFGEDNTPIDSQTLEEILLSIDSELNSDTSLTLKASWNGVNYTIHFDANGGTFVSGLEQESIETVYGQTFAKEFPEVSKIGQSHEWHAPDGTVYSSDMVFASIGQKASSGDKYEITFTANWINNPYKLTINFANDLNNKFILYKDGEVVSNGQEFVLIYNETSISFQISPDVGYGFRIDTTNLDGQFEGSKESDIYGISTFTISNLYNNSEITISSIPAKNKLALVFDKVASVSVQIDSQEAQEFTDISGLFNQNFDVYTESVVTIILTSVKGYEFTSKDIKMAGSGEISISISEDKKVATIIWSKFTSNSTITANATASLNTITLSDISDIISSLTINGQYMDINGDEVQVFTDSVVTISATLKYGYKGILDEEGNLISISVSSVTYPNNELIDSQNETFNNTSRNYVISATLGGNVKINEDFAITFEATEREFNFNLAVKEGQEELGSITSQVSQTVKYGEKLILTSLPTSVDKYILYGWEINGVIVSYEDTDLIISEQLKEQLESVNIGETINVIANFTYLQTDVTFKSDSYGSFTVSQNENFNLIQGGRSQKLTIDYAKDIIINVEARNGYEIGKLVVDGVELTIKLENQTFVVYYKYEQPEESYQTLKYGEETTITLGELNLTLTLNNSDKKENVEIIIPFDVDNSFTNFEIGYTPSVVYINVQAGIMTGWQSYYPSGDGGKIYIANSEGELLGDSLYLNENNEPMSSEELALYKGISYKVASYTGATYYFVIVSEEGFTSTFVATGGSQANNADGTLAWISDISDSNGNVVASALFTADENDILINLVTVSDTGTIESALSGVINATETALVRFVSGKGSYQATMTAITGSSIELNFNTTFTHELIDENGTLKYFINGKYETAVGGEIIERSDYLETGYTTSSTLIINKVKGDLIINIFVEPKVFNLKFYIDENTSYTINNALTYGKDIDLSTLSTLTEEERNKILTPTKSGYTFGGYYTAELGASKMYLDRNGNTVSKWLDDGYTYVSSSSGKSGYLPDANFDVSTQTFTIYAYWIYNQAFINVQFEPANITQYLKGFSIANIITNQTILVDDQNKWYGAVSEGGQLNISGIDIEGYKFISWTLYQDDESLGEKGQNFTFTVTKGNYVLKAIYQPIYELSVTKGGSVQLVQNGNVVSGNSYDPNSIVSIVASCQPGYDFVKFIDSKTGEEYKATYDDINKTYTYTFSELIDKPLYIQAVFEGKDVNVKLDASNALEVHKNLKVFVNGQEIKNYDNFVAKIDQKITIQIEKTLGFDFEFIGANFERQDLGYNRYQFNYILGMENVVSQNGNLVLNLKLNATREEVNLHINLNIKDIVSEDEKILAAEMQFIDFNGTSTSIKFEDTVKTLYGQSSILKLNILDNYKLGEIKIFDTLIERDVTEMYSGGQLVIDLTLLGNNYSDDYYLTITLERKLWIDESVRSQTLEGDGTKENPYLIKSAADFGLMAYLVNNGIVNEQGQKYADCIYKLTNDINFSGNYWEPIGTKENPFNGEIDLGKYNIENLLLYKTYSNPKTSYSGLFLYVTKDANIIQDNSTLIIILSIIGGIIFLILLIVLIIFLVRKKRKDKLEDIANA